MISAREALGFGLVARVVAKEAWLEEAKRVAHEIATKGPIAVRLAEAWLIVGSTIGAL